MIVIRRWRRVNLGLCQAWPDSFWPAMKIGTEVCNAMNMILKLGAVALTGGMAITATGYGRLGASTHMTCVAARVATSANSAAPIHSLTQNAEDQMPRINVEEAKKLVAEGKAVIIDVRGSDSYKASHIKGALDVPMKKLEAGDFKDLPKDKRIIAYCS
jgi:Rhodanese-like domain